MTLERVQALPRPLAFVLPGGGALGAYQVGVLRALAEAGIEPDLLLGVSAGSVNATMYAWHHGVEGVRHLEHVWQSLRRRDLLRFHPGRLALAFSGRRPSFVDNRHGAAFIRRWLGSRLLEEAPIRVGVVATNVFTGRAVALTRGDAASAVVASSAFPGLYPPVERDGLLLMDGGVVADIPLDLAAELGAAGALVLAVPALSEGTPPLRAIDLLFRASTFGVEAHGRTVMLRPPVGLKVLEVLAPPSPITTFALGSTAGILEESYTNARRWLGT